MDVDEAINEESNSWSHVFVAAADMIILNGSDFLIMDNGVGSTGAPYGGITDKLAILLFFFKP